MTLLTEPSSLIDVASLAAQLAQPRRLRLAEARAATRGEGSGERAWQHLFDQGLIPLDLLRSPDRRFAVVNTERRPAAAGDDDLELRESPATVEAAVTLASDAAGVLEAERLARTVRSQLVAWGAEPARRIDWVIVTHQIPFTFRQTPAFNCALYSVERALRDIDVEFSALRADLPWLPPFVNEVIRANDGWTIAARESLEVPKAYDPPPSLVGARFDALDNPFATALKLWALGYVLDHLCERERPEARLFTPVIDAPQNLPSRLRAASAAQTTG
jgi:hypothetical protein